MHIYEYFIRFILLLLPRIGNCYELTVKYMYYLFISSFSLFSILTTNDSRGISTIYPDDAFSLPSPTSTSPQYNSHSYSQYQPHRKPHYSHHYISQIYDLSIPLHVHFYHYYYSMMILPNFDYLFSHPPTHLTYSLSNHAHCLIFIFNLLISLSMAAFNSAVCAFVSVSGWIYGGFCLRRAFWAVWEGCWTGRLIFHGGSALFFGVMIVFIIFLILVFISFLLSIYEE